MSFLDIKINQKPFRSKSLFRELIFNNGFCERNYNQTDCLSRLLSTSSFFKISRTSQAFEFQVPQRKNESWLVDFKYLPVTRTTYLLFGASFANRQTCIWPLGFLHFIFAAKRTRRGSICALCALCKSFVGESFLQVNNAEESKCGFFSPANKTVDFKQTENFLWIAKIETCSIVQDLFK